MFSATWWKMENAQMQILTGGESGRRPLRHADLGPGARPAHAHRRRPQVARLRRDAPRLGGVPQVGAVGGDGAQGGVGEERDAHALQHEREEDGALRDAVPQVPEYRERDGDNYREKFSREDSVQRDRERGGSLRVDGDQGTQQLMSRNETVNLEPCIV